MTLSELVSLKVYLNSLPVLQYKSAVNEFVDKLNNMPLDTKELAHTQSSIISALTATKSTISDKLSSIIEEINKQIAEEATKYDLPYSQRATKFNDDCNGRVLPLPDDLKEKLIGRIQLLSDWHYPGLEINPHCGEFTPHLVSLDPLYITSIYQEYLDITVAKFPELYQSRIRPYLLPIHPTDGPNLSVLPTNQFGLIFSWNTFNYLPVEIIAKYLTLAYDLLTDGGSFLFGYNNAELVYGARHVEWGGMVYTTESMLIDLATALGYTITTTVSEDRGWHNFSWIEIKKPGTLHTIRAHQTLGQILDKSDINL